jgi:hypothetical protein
VRNVQLVRRNVRKNSKTFARDSKICSPGPLVRSNKGKSCSGETFLEIFLKILPYMRENG